jgi:hypothetical protein
MSLIDLVQSTTTCNSFPKIFGGSSYWTELSQIDIFNDYLALTGSADISPFLALTSISTGGKYYWAKALSLKINSEFSGV